MREMPVIPIAYLPRPDLLKEYLGSPILTTLLVASVNAIMQRSTRERSFDSMRTKPLHGKFDERKTARGLRAEDFTRISQASRLSASNIRAWMKVDKGGLRPNDYIIAVMGPTGAGKSTFISSAVGHDAGIGSGLQSFTSEISAIRISLDYDFNVVLVDTPGFDDTFLSDLDILKLISDWLRSRGRIRFRLAGMIYLHRISDNRMGGTPLKNLRLFQKLCGKNQYDKVTLMTTMWSGVQPEEGYAREKELKEIYWESMIRRGSSVRRYEDSPESAWKIIRPLLGRSKRLIQIQRELHANWKEVPDTSAGRELYAMVGALARRQQELLRQLQSEVIKASDTESLKALIQEFADLGKRRETVLREMKELKTSFFRRLYRRARRIQAHFPYYDRCEALILGLAHKDDLQARIARIDSEGAGLMSAFIGELVRNRRVAAAEEVKVMALLGLLIEKAEQYPSCFFPPSTQGDEVNLHETIALNRSLAVKETFSSVCSFHDNILPLYLAPFNEIASRVEFRHITKLYDYLCNKLQQGEQMYLISDIASGLTYLHQLGIVHGNLRAENVFVSDNARAYISASNIVVHDAMVPFLPRWTAPELQTGLSQKTQKSDIWSFGCLCYEVLTADLPCYESRCWDLISELRTGNIPPRPTTVDDEIWNLIIRCWEENPDKRPNCEYIQQIIHKRTTGKKDLRPESMDPLKLGLLETPASTEVDYEKVYHLILSLLRVDTTSYEFHGRGT